MPFTGFAPEMFTFLEGLSQNNSKTWFDAHRADYDDHCVASAKDFIAEIGPKLRDFAPDVRFEPRINGSIFRINRDVRFSKDKRPYKTNFDLWFWLGEKRGWETPGFYLRLTPQTFIAGAGMHGFTPPQLTKFRASVLAETSGKELEKLSRSLTLGTASRKTIPRGFDPAHPRSRFLLFEGLNANFEEPLPKSVHTARFLYTCLEIFRQAAPVSRWLQKYL